MGSSLPVIATNVGGTSEIVKNNITGLLINSRNTIQLQDAVTMFDNNNNPHITRTITFIIICNAF